MKSTNIFSLLVLSSILLSACQPALPPERPLNTGDRPRVTRGQPEVVREEVLPTLTIARGEAKSEMKLRSQTSRYLNAQNTALEITLTSSDLAYCQNENPALGEGEEELKIIIRSKDGKTPVDKIEFAGDDRFELSATYRSNKPAPAGQTETSAPDNESAQPSAAPADVTFSGADFAGLKITDLNAAIARGHLSITSADLSVEGEFFTAVCK
jgi:hypothetical protein